jgi:ribonuclease M5
MLVITEAVIVEGKYDKIKLGSLVDCLIVETNGFSILRDHELLAFIRSLAVDRGVIILTDSDSSGFKIRNFLKGAIQEGTVKHAYIPDVAGKEKRKAKPSSEGMLGVEGIHSATVINALLKAGATVSSHPSPFTRQGGSVTKADFFADGLSGKENSRDRRNRFKKELGLPARMSANALLQYINLTMDRIRYKSIAEKIK